MKSDRRSFIKTLAAASTLASLPPVANAQAPGPSGRTARRTLIKGGYVASLDPAVGELRKGDVLIEGSTIAQVGPNLSAADAELVDASSKLVLPGLIDTHRHCWSTSLRTTVADGDFPVYFKVILQTLGPLLRPEDVYISNMLGAIGAINSGVTTVLDWSHIMNSPEYADAAIKGLSDTGVRAIFAHGDPIKPFGEWWSTKSTRRHPQDIRRVQKQYFSSEDQLITLAMAIRGPEASTLETSIDDIKLARELGLRVTVHMGVPGLAAARGVTKLNEAKILGPDITYVHTLLCTDEELQMIAASGGTISISPATEMLSQLGFPSLQRWKRFGLKPALSIDNESRAPTDLFTQMRGLLMSDRQQEIQRAAKEGGRAILVPVREILECATLQGARATGLERKLGSLSPGKKADIILFDLDDLTLIPARKDPVATMVLFGQPSHVSWVWIDGQVRKREGRLVGVDINRVRKLTDASYEFFAREGGLESSGS
jgi:cytosine/adenosine deaminase-related metal-dependent hydrolase